VRASQHCQGACLEKGPRLHVLRRHLKHQKKGDASAYGLMLSIATAPCWSELRIYEAGFTPDPLCQRCHKAVDEDLHRDHRVERSQFLCNHALKNKKMPCMWLRGIPPAGWEEGDPEVPQEETLYVDLPFPELPAGVEFCEFVWGTGGSGGESTKDPRLIRCGWSYAHVALFSSGGLHFLHGAFGLLAGELQTVPRAELTAFYNLWSK